jgi:V/A-type H+/Na+-transporting ATPase subunit E
MALDNVVDEILESASKEADQILKAGEKEKAAILQQAADAVSSKQKVQQKETEDAVKRLRQQELSSAELEEKRIVLNARKEMLDRTFEEVNSQLADMSSADKARLYGSILEQGRKVIKDPKIYCPAGEAKLLPVKNGEKVEEVKMGPGLILESKDGSVRIDYTFKTILEGIWEKELKNISNILFG